MRDALGNARIQLTSPVDEHPSNNNAATSSEVFRFLSSGCVCSSPIDELGALCVRYRATSRRNVKLVK